MEVLIKSNNRRDGFVNSDLEEQCLQNHHRRKRQTGINDGFATYLRANYEAMENSSDPKDAAFLRSLHEELAAWDTGTWEQIP